jgi:hypothetical protein
MRSLGIRILSLLLVFWGVNPSMAYGQTVSREYQLKAVFLYNFVQFTEWPTNAFPGVNAPVVIGVLGTDPFGQVLEETVRGEKKNGRSLIVERYRRVEDIKDCHALFVCRSEENRLPEILAALHGRSILTVGETDGFAQNGGMIRFLTEKNKIRLRIYVEAARAANLTVSSKLLRLAENASPGKE